MFKDPQAPTGLNIHRNQQSELLLFFTPSRIPLITFLTLKAEARKHSQADPRDIHYSIFDIKFIYYRSWRLESVNICTELKFRNLHISISQLHRDADFRA